MRESELETVRETVRETETQQTDRQTDRQTDNKVLPVDDLTSAVQGGLGGQSPYRDKPSSLCWALYK